MERSNATLQLLGGALRSRATWRRAARRKAFGERVSSRARQPLNVQVRGERRESGWRSAAGDRRVLFCERRSGSGLMNK